jgi:hypothetical protein
VDPEIEQSFVLLRASWSVDQARPICRANRSADHVIVYDTREADQYFLYSLADAERQLELAESEQTVAAVLASGHLEPTPTIALHAAEAPQGPAVVVDDGRLVGFVRRRVVTRGPTRGPASRPSTAAKGEAAGQSERSVEAEFPDSVQAGATESLLVMIRVGPASAAGLAIDLAAGEVIDIVVQPRKGFVIEGPSEGALKVPTADESLPLQFKLRAIDEGDGRINVFAFHRGQPLGMIDLRPSITAPSATEASGSKPTRRRRARKLAAPASAVPDLSMLVEERSYGDRIEYLIRLTAPDLDLNLKSFGPLKLRSEPERFFDEFFSDIEGMPIDGPQAQASARKKLETKGAYLFDVLFPQDMKEQLWSVRDRITSVVVQSEEPWIPWELCRLQGREDGRTVDGPFLAEAYAITRWMPGIPIKRQLSLKDIALVVPDDSGLPLAAAERDYVLSLAGRGHRVTSIPATYVEVQSGLAAGQYDAWHFTGHGAARTNSSDRASIYLQAQEELTPLDLSGTAANLGVANPLVFLNACQVGRGGMSLTGIGGWARRFMEAGAGAFIGTYWSVYDTPAFEFAKRLYEELLKGSGIGNAVRDARLAIRDQGDPTWLAYTVFGDPSAAVAAR